MSIDEHQHVALPKLYGQPAYARPPRVFDATERTPDVDDLPIEAIQTPEERVMAEALHGRPYGERPRNGGPAPQLNGHGLRPRPFSLRTIGRLFGAKD